MSLQSRKGELMKASSKIFTGLAVAGGTVAAITAFSKWHGAKSLVPRLVANCEMPAPNGMNVGKVFKSAKKFIEMENEKRE